MSQLPPSHETPFKLRTFGGVFVPNVLTILGVILFMRTGWVVGQAGLIQALEILVIANAITFLTSLSLSAVATNTRVGSGGAYFIVSRSLGLEIGGSIGVPLFLAQAISVTFYAIGFTESLLPFFPWLPVKFFAALVITLIFILTWLGSDWAVKAQSFIFGILALSLLSFFAGASPDLKHWEANLEPMPSGSADFWTIFAIFFPAVTGIMAGASMSGDLKNPSRSIPLGTLAAVGVTFLIYAAQMIGLAWHVDRALLQNNPQVMNQVAIFPSLIYTGLWAATLSSALASLMAAPRTLQALACDGVLPRFLAKKSGPKNEPRHALVVSFILAFVCAWMGKLDLIAPIISMFFLATYGMLNLVAFLENIVSNPSYRPTFKVHWILSFVGALGCLGVMLLLNAWATLGAIVLMGGLYLYLTQSHYQTAWGDMRTGFWFTLSRFSLLQLTHSSQHLRNWRPVMLVLTGNPATRLQLVQFANWMESKCGFLFLCQILIGPWEKVFPRSRAAKESIELFIKENGFSAAAQVITATDFEQGVTHLLQTAGIGPLSPNTVLIGSSADVFKKEMFLRAIHRILELRKNLVIFSQEKQAFKGQLHPYIDVWWRSRKNGALMATLAHLLQTNPTWSKHTLRIFMIIAQEEGIEEARANMEAQLKDSRIRAELHIMTSSKTIQETITEHSQFSSLCFLGINFYQTPETLQPLLDMETMVLDLHGNVFITKNWQDIEF